MKFQSSFFGWVMLFFLTPFVSCESKQSKAEKKEVSLSDTAKFYSIERYIKDEMQYVDLRDFSITETKITAGDSTTKSITKDEFLSIATEILNQTNWFAQNKFLYKETVFQDLGTESYTINYQTDQADIKSIDLLLNEQTNLPKRLFIRMIRQEGEITSTIQYSWVTGKQFSIAKSVKKRTDLIEQSSKTIQWINRP